jgi:hypothetical protein
MPCLLLYGDSNIGKTQIISKFQRHHPPEYDEEKGVEMCKIVAMQMPPTPDQQRFYASLLFERGAPFNATARLSALEKPTRELLRKVAPRMLIVDEVHHLLAGSYRELRASLNLLKFLANDLRISIVLVGTQDAVIALQTDPQMVRRFTRFEIPRWNESEAFRCLHRCGGRHGVSVDISQDRSPQSCTSKIPLRLLFGRQCFQHDDGTAIRRLRRFSLAPAICTRAALDTCA